MCFIYPKDGKSLSLSWKSLYCSHLVSLISRFVLSDTRIVDHGEGFYPGMSIPCADSFSGFCVHGKCEINKYNMATCRFVTASAVNVSDKYIKMSQS